MLTITVIKQPPGETSNTLIVDDGTTKKEHVISPLDLLSKTPMELAEIFVEWVNTNFPNATKKEIHQAVTSTLDTHVKNTDYQRWSVARQAQQLPGVNDIIKCPACDNNTGPSIIYTVVQHLNDYHEWTRDQIADWLETLDVDMEFKPEYNGDS